MLRLCITLLCCLSFASFAVQHPLCEPQTTKVQQKTPQNTTKVDPINFKNKKILKTQTKNHRNEMYKLLVANNVPENVARYVFTFQFLERPTIHYKNQPEAKFLLENYTKRFIKRTPKAKKFLKKHKETFLHAQAKYQVDKEAIVALMLLESNLGKNKGKLNVLNALFTMSYAGSTTRPSFFRSQLIAAFQMLSSKKYFFRHNTVGSWAGAVGYVQFIPTSVLAYAVDGNDDGVIDIINSKEDAIYSAANYLHKAHWKYARTIMQETPKPNIEKPEDICQLLEKPYKEGTLTLGTLNPQERYFITYNNHKAILRWNRSFAFSYTVHSIINELQKDEK